MAEDKKKKDQKPKQQSTLLGKLTSTFGKRKESGSGLGTGPGAPERNKAALRAAGMLPEKKEAEAERRK